MPRSIFLVQTNPMPGREAEFDDWYTNQHLREVVAIPGFVSAQRYELSPAQRDEDAKSYPYRYIAVYEFDGDPQPTLDGLSEAIAGGMYISPAMNPNRSAVAFDPIGEKLTG